MIKTISREEAKKKGLTKFYTGKKCKHGHDSEKYVARNACIECTKITMQKYYSSQKGKEYVEKYNKSEKRKENVEKYNKSEKGILRAKKSKEKNKIYQKTKYEKNKRFYIQYNQKYSYANKIKNLEAQIKILKEDKNNKELINNLKEQVLNIRAYFKNYRNIRDEKYKKKYGRTYYEKNKNELNKKRRLRQKTDIQYRLSRVLGLSLWRTIKYRGKVKKNNKTLELIGVKNINELMVHLENKFKPGMNWQNYGQWHIDHIRPVSSFDLSKKSEQFKCFNYQNLQPLWAIENIKKGNKY